MSDPVQITLRLPAFTASLMRSDHPEDPGSLPWCTGCLSDIQEGEEILYLAGRRMHADCARRRLGPDTPVDAWLTVARHVAAYPSRHSAATIRAVLTNLIAMASANRTSTSDGTDSPVGVAPRT